MAQLLYPKAFSVPISVLCDSTIRVIVVRLTSAATRKKINGKILPIAPILSAFCSYSTYACVEFLSRTYHSG